MAAMTAAELLRAIAEALFGSSWGAGDLAATLGVNGITKRRWLDGTAEPPPGIWAEFLTLAVKRTTDLNTIIPELERRAKDR